MATDLWWGTYPPEGLGTPTGVGEGLWRQRGENAELMLELAASSFVIAHPDLPLLYAVSETDSTEVHVIDITERDRPRLVDSMATGGQSGCHLMLSRDALTLYVSHYTSGDLAVVPLSAAGAFAVDAPSQILRHEGSGPRQDRQESSHIHFAGYAPGESHVLVADLGTDQLRAYAIEQDGSLADAGIASKLPPGSGPRHFAVRDQLIYVVCELDHQLRTLRWDGPTGTAEIIDAQPTTLAPQRTGDTIADAHIVALDAMLLVSVRGCDVVSVFDLSPEGAPSYRAAWGCGYWPRHFAVIGSHVVVGAEKGHEARSFDLADVVALEPERERGAIATLPSTVAQVTSPACVVSA